MTAMDGEDLPQGVVGLAAQGTTGLRPHAGPLALFAVASALWTVVSWPKGVEHCASDLWIYFGMALKAEQPELFARDLLFGDPANYAEWPLFTAWLQFFLRTVGDLTLGLKVLTFPLNLIFMIGAYAVFLELTRLRPWSAALAVLAAVPMSVPASAEIFGVGPATQLVPRTILTAGVPFLWWAYGRGMLRNRPHLLNATFFAVGLLANVHGISAFLLTQILLVVTFFHGGLGRHNVLRCVRLGLVAAVGALPLIVMVVTRPEAPVETAPAETLVEIFQARNPYLYPQTVLLGHTPEIVLHALTVVLLVAIPIALVLCGRDATGGREKWLVGLAVLASWYTVYSFRALPILAWVTVTVLLARRRMLGPAEQMAVSFGLATFLVGVGGVLFLQALYVGFGLPPFGALHQFRAIRFSGFGLLLLVAIAATWLSASWRDLGAAARRALVLLTVLAAGVLARDTYRTYGWTRRDAARDDLVAAASWARGATSRDALFLMDSPLFRVLARRSLVASTKDIGMLFMVRRNVLEAHRRVEEQRAAGDDVSALLRLGREYGADYVVVRAGAVRQNDDRSVVYRNLTYAVLRQGAVVPEAAR